MEGNTIQLTCHVNVTSSVTYMAQFERNDEVITNATHDYAIVSPLEHKDGDRDNAHFNLTIAESNKERDEGEYTCRVKDFHGNTNAGLAKITFVTVPIVKFNAINEHVKSEKGRKQAAFSVDYEAFPPATFYIYNPQGEQISSDESVMNRQKFDVVITDRSIRLSVKRPDINDFGNYTIVGSTVGQNFSTTLSLTVSGELKI